MRSGDRCLAAGAGCVAGAHRTARAATGDGGRRGADLALPPARVGEPLAHPGHGHVRRLPRPVRGPRVARQDGARRAGRGGDRRPDARGGGRLGPGGGGRAGEGRAGVARLGHRSGLRRRRLRHRGGAGAHPDLLRRPRPAPGDGRLLRRQRGIVAPDGARGDATGGPHDPGLPAPVREWLDGLAYALLAEEWRQ